MGAKQLSFYSQFFKEIKVLSVCNAARYFFIFLFGEKINNLKNNKKMNISKASSLIVKGKNGDVIARIAIGMVQLNKMSDKTQTLVIQEAK